VRRQQLIIVNGLVRLVWGLLALAKRVRDGVSSLREHGEQELLNLGVRVIDIAGVLVAIRVSGAAPLPSEP
jgi:hypothetical protein